MDLYKSNIEWALFTLTSKIDQIDLTLDAVLNERSKEGDICNQRDFDNLEIPELLKILKGDWKINIKNRISKLNTNSPIMNKNDYKYTVN